MFTEQERRKQLESGAATANQNTASQRDQSRALVGVQGVKPSKDPKISRFKNPEMVMFFGESGQKVAGASCNSDNI